MACSYQLCIRDCRQPRGAKAMMAMPHSVTATPSQSQGPGRAPSTAHSQANATATCDAAVGRIRYARRRSGATSAARQTGPGCGGRQQQPGAAPLAQPQPGQIAAEDLGQRRGQEQARVVTTCMTDCAGFRAGGTMGHGGRRRLHVPAPGPRMPDPHRRRSK